MADYFPLVLIAGAPAQLPTGDTLIANITGSAASGGGGGGGGGEGGGDALQSLPLSQFAPTTSAQLAGVITNETGTGSLVFSTNPVLTTPTIGAATATTVNKVTITPPSSGATLTIADGATLTVQSSATVSGVNTGDQALDPELAAIAALSSSADKVPYFTGSGTAALADLTAAGRALIDDASAAAQKTTIGLGNVDNTSDSNKPISTATQAALDTKQTTDAELTAIAGLTSESDTVPYFTGSGTAALTGLTVAGRALMDDADAAAQRATLGIGASVSSADPMIVSAFLGSIYG